MVWALIFTQMKLLLWDWFLGWCFSSLSYWEPGGKQRNVINSHCSRPSVLLCRHTWQLENDQVAAAFWFLLLSLIPCLTKRFVNALRTSWRGQCGFPSSQQVEPASLASCHRLIALWQKPGWTHSFLSAFLPWRKPNRNPKSLCRERSISQLESTCTGDLL